MKQLGIIRRMYYRDGLSLSEIERRTGLPRKTVRRWLDKFVIKDAGLLWQSVHRALCHEFSHYPFLDGTGSNLLKNTFLAKEIIEVGADKNLVELHLEPLIFFNLLCASLHMQL